MILIQTGIDNLKKVYDSTPDFCDEKALEDVTRQLYEVHGGHCFACMLCLFEFFPEALGYNHVHT